MGVTAQVLCNLPRSVDPNLLVGMDHFDDAAVYRLDPATALVSTVDFFPPLVDDPYVFGQIAAANALSDIYAMGARPICALNIVGFPDTSLPVEILSEILLGGSERVTKAGAVIGGGHSVRDDEIKYGLSITGVVHPDRIMTNSGARPGDVLVLTKPIGSGVLTSAAKGDLIDETDLAEAVDVMTDLNAGACDAMMAVGVNAVTDITGFGLIGHAHEIAEASEVTVELDARSVPLLERTLELAGQGILTRTHMSNQEHLGDALDVRDVDETLLGVLADAQTSGGLLISVAADRADQLVKDLKRRRTRASAIVGRVLPRSRHSVILT